MATDSAFYLVIFALFCHQDRVTCRPNVAYLYDASGEYMVCNGFMDGDTPGVCTGGLLQTFLFEDGPTEENLATTYHNCNGNFYSYHLFDTTPSQIWRLTLPVSLDGAMSISILDTTASIDGVTTFEICCDLIFFAAGNTVYVQNLDDTGDTRITSPLYQASGSITDIDVCCFNDDFRVFHTIDDDGLYGVSMDGSINSKLIDYGAGSTAVADLDVNCGIGYLAFGIGDSMYVWEFAEAVSADLPISLSSLTPWEERAGQTVSALSLASESGVPRVLTAWTGLQTFALTFTTVSESSEITNSDLQLAFRDVFLCLDAQDCSLSCSAGLTCPCDNLDQFGRCCAGLCVPQSYDPNQSTGCLCSNECTLGADGCAASGALPTASADIGECPLDLISAVKCVGGTRETSSSIYALSLYSLTRICATDVKGTEQPLPPGTFAFQTDSVHTFQFFFQGSTKPKSYKGKRYGLYNAQTSNPAIGESGNMVDTIPTIVQERSDEIYTKSITISELENSVVTIRLRVARYCNTRRIRWRKDNVVQSRYNGKVAMTFDPFATSDEGIYEVYFQGRIKRDWRRIIRVIERTDTCAITGCIANGGVCSYSGLYCVCPPGRVGFNCEGVCPKGTFGVRGRCEFSCEGEFGKECADCRDVLFCLEDPFGCQCYPGYEQPNCTPCRSGFYGVNCKKECPCSTGEQCDAFDGTCWP
ncbi:uncharacterized protein [Apostichopus japonicus]|uniref:uncharacterized protein n=1 Tax=Stichopus japonicus TaxID=307972 RepID=UPI003AB2382D